MVLRLPVEWLESISRCYLIILVYWILALKMGNMLCCAKATEQKGNLKTIQMVSQIWTLQCFILQDELTLSS